MKRFFLMAVFLLSSLSIFARKEYCMVMASHAHSKIKMEIKLSGNVPSRIKGIETTDPMDIINELAKEGYVVEQYQVSSSDHLYNHYFILAKEVKD